jgi:hypothetical protein
MHKIPFAVFLYLAIPVTDALAQGFSIIDFVGDSTTKKIEAAQVKINGVADSSQGSGDFNDGD